MRIRPILAKTAKGLLRLALMTLIVFIVIEGLSSVVIFGYEFLLKSRPGLASRAHVDFDAELGWVNRPNLELADFYGPGLHFATNSRSFRNREEFTDAVPEGKVRVVCVGDSFTLGIGVENRHSWPALLMEAEPRIEALNLGEAGYGVDQAYLRFVRDTAGLEYDVVVFAFIYDDFLRMRSKTFCGYGKPVLEIVDGRLETTNVPVPKVPGVVRFLSKRRDAVEGLRSVQIGKRAAGRVLPRPTAVQGDDGLQVPLRVFARVAGIARAKGATPVFVFLPQAERARNVVLEWGETLERELGAAGLHYLDLVRAMDPLRKEEVERYFDRTWLHYTEAGNRFVTGRILEGLRAVPEIARALESAK